MLRGRRSRWFGGVTGAKVVGWREGSLGGWVEGRESRWKGGGKGVPVARWREGSPGG